jgi:hypothetical protein
MRIRIDPCLVVWRRSVFRYKSISKRVLAYLRFYSERFMFAALAAGPPSEPDNSEERLAVRTNVYPCSRGSTARHRVAARERSVNAARGRTAATSAATAAGIGTSPACPGDRGSHFDVPGASLRRRPEAETLRQDAENGNPFDVRVVESSRTACAEIFDSKAQ